MARQGAWIDVYPFSGRKLEVIGNDIPVELNPGLKEFVESEWAPRAEKGWKSSWVAFANRVGFGRTLNGDNAESCDVVECGSMPFHYINGMNTAIEQGKPFAPQLGFNPSLSVGFLTATEDAKVIFQRRSPYVHCPNILIHEPCGYMASMAFAPRSECDDPKYAQDPRLFSIKDQLEARAREITEQFGIGREDVDYKPQQDFLGADWNSLEMYFSTTGQLKARSSDLMLPEGAEYRFVPFEHLKELISNQGRLSRVDTANYRPDDVREIPLIGESAAGLIWGYEALTGDNLDIYDTVERLNRDGLGIKIYDTSRGQDYEFPTTF
ncbi:hypothetical protein CMI37_26150 [Candidatus Pacearchaeota archaeon]|nr:hypothetical protein [Candidatus Pacearchaeota archaeon]|tara:strand:- start:4170 stop:5141 length:972 start_codon:yes stop_codon:yes gene_type:complete